MLLRCIKTLALVLEPDMEARTPPVSLGWWQCAWPFLAPSCSLFLLSLFPTEFVFLSLVLVRLLCPFLHHPHLPPEGALQLSQVGGWDWILLPSLVLGKGLRRG